MGNEKEMKRADLSLDVNRGPLAGRVPGEYNDVSMQVLTVLLNWKMKEAFLPAACREELS